MKQIFCGLCLVAVQMLASAPQVGGVRITVAPPPPPSNAKPVWQWSVEERLAVRADAEMARLRVEHAKRGRSQSALSMNASRQDSTADEFEGKTHPELFLPHEVFRKLIDLAYAGPERATVSYRDAMLREAQQRGLPADFWEQLQSLSAVHIADVKAQDKLLSALSREAGGTRDRTAASLQLKYVDVCRSRADALAAARQHFGRERFDRFLYEVVAVHMFHASDRVADEAVLRKNEIGCR